jgi:hypothetical protein
MASYTTNARQALLWTENGKADYKWVFPAGAERVITFSFISKADSDVVAAFQEMISKLPDADKYKSTLR